MMKTQMMFLGPPACGKGTQTDMLAKEFNLPHIDTGTLLRAEISANTEEGQIAKGFMDKGQLVPADLVSKIIIKKIFSKEAENGYILDGFPRSIEQADLLENALEEAGKNDKTKRIVIKMDVDKDVLLNRIVNRRMCRKCNKIYNLKTLPPKKDGVCDVCGAELYQRTDDNEQTALSRFETYNKQTAPLVEYYEKKGLLVTVDANGSTQEVYENILKAINS